MPHGTPFRRRLAPRACRAVSALRRFRKGASVQGWERTGALLRAIVVRILYVLLLRYVDDYFGCDRPSEAAAVLAPAQSTKPCARRGEVEHALNCVTRLLRAVMGQSVLADRKLVAGAPIGVLGLHLRVSRYGFMATPLADKVEKWSAGIRAALAQGKLAPGEAAKLAGRLAWASSHMFKRLGRALLRPRVRFTHEPVVAAMRPRPRPIFSHAHRRTSSVGPSLRLALEWWLEILQLDLGQAREWEQRRQDRAIILADARGWPPRAAAVVLAAGELHWTTYAVPDKLLEFFNARGDNQIGGLELIAIALALSTFPGPWHFALLAAARARAASQTC